MAARPLRLLRTHRRFTLICSATAILALASVVWSFHRKPRAWAPAEVPIAFWAWRTESPSEADLQWAKQKTGTQTLFLRAGQIDVQDGKPDRIRPLSGPMPQGMKLHLVYNATRALLTQLENIDEASLASSLAETFASDLERSRRDRVTIVGLQLDIDVPTRLLPRYATTLRALRARMPRGMELSITGLPTWMDSPALSGVLDQVDFWIPQCYGSEIPERLNQSIPISSTQFVKQAMTRARALNRPFYAGLADYSYALLYSGSGTLITLRGDLDPLQVANDANLELVERQILPGSSEWRYVYRARAVGVIDGLAMSGGDSLVINSPTTESLRLAARVVRENAGDKLLGICVFRLPVATDQATLTREQIAAALADQQTNSRQQPNINVSAAVVMPPNESRPAKVSHEVRVLLVNQGTEGVPIGDGVTVDLTIPPGSAPQINPKGFSQVSTLCTGGPAGSSSLVPCSERRANVLRFTATTLAPGDRAEVGLVFSIPPPAAFFAHLEVKSDDGQTHVSNQQLIVSTGATK